MKLTSLLLAPLIPSLAAASIANAKINIMGTSFSGQDLLNGNNNKAAQSNNDASTLDLSVPGDNPLNFCQEPSGDILTIESVDLSPNPPVPGQTLTIKATGTFHQDVTEGAKVLLQVKYGLIRLINQEADLCEQITNVDLECPLEKGKMVITKEVDLPKEIPKGRYSVLADVYTKEKEKITCLTAQVQF